MSNVLIDRQKIDILANAISDKSGVPVTMTLDEMVEAVDGIETGGNLQAKTYNVSSAGTVTVTADSGYDGLSEVEVSVPNASVETLSLSSSGTFITESGQRKWQNRAHLGVESAGWVSEGDTYGDYTKWNAVASGTSVTPTESAQTIGGANYMMEGAVTVNAISPYYVGSGIPRRDAADLTVSGDAVGVPDGYYEDGCSARVASGTAGTPTATKGTVSNHSVSVTPSVTNTTGYITGSTINGTAISVSASELVSGTYTVDSSGTKDVTNYASASVPAGTAGTPSASKGAVSNHSVSVTPSVTNTTGWITGSTKTGTAVTVSASELVSGSQTITSNQTVDVTNLAEVVVNVSGGGGSGMTVATATATPSSASASISFTGLSGEPTSFAVISSGDLATGASPYKTAAVVFDGSDLHGQTITNTSNAQVSYDGTHFSKTYSNGTLTITGSTYWQANEYKLVYTYGGNSANIDTADVQVGSGATSITFTGLTDEPDYFSCIFKSNFSTSSGYQRVIAVVYDGNSTYGLAMDSGAKAESSWSYTYNNGSLTISSQGTNNGGYFHQPGYYQLTYVLEGESPYERVSRTYRASTSSQTLLIEPSTGYEAMSQVSVTIPAITQTNLVAGNIKSGTTVTINNGQDNLWSVTGTYEGSGGTSKNVQVLQSTSRTNASSLTKVLGDLTVSKTGTYDVYWSGGRSNTSTSYTWGTRLYVDGTGYDTENTTWTNNCQSNHLSNVSLTANQKLSVYARGRTGSYYTFAPMLVIIEA